MWLFIADVKFAAGAVTQAQKISLGTEMFLHSRELLFMLKNFINQVRAYLMNVCFALWKNAFLRT
jgi:hypothetical protein